ncbi:hypothetical protein [Fluviispira multicolorata]|uniref:Lipoprotein n=1 Tax=Fluviispira multicolorata TaxID=2654512 RepID=A0A833N7Y8_9BACT|nr:hypothetical protein [Fluviispira multicolorata]KAB8033461.1 hypothetical protein GCL57_01805 [Fluviispira multicolorata]
MCIRYHSSLAKFLTYMLLSFFISCESTKNQVNTGRNNFIQPIFIPIKRSWFEYYDQDNWRFIIQEIEYIDGKKMRTLSSIWYMDFTPIEVVLLDNPNPSEILAFTFNKGNKVLFRKTEVFLPFSSVSNAENYESLLPTCGGGEIRAIARIVNNKEYIGVPKDDISDIDKQKRPWFVLGNVICIKIFNQSKL